MQEELFQIPDHIKKKYANYPLSKPLSPEQVGSAKILARKNTLLGKNYLVTLDSLVARIYRLALDLQSDTELSIQLVLEKLDILVEDLFEANGKSINLPFSVSGPGNY